MPCPLCWLLCHLLAIPTLGLSLCFLQSMCITDTEQNMDRRFGHYNKDYLNKKGWQILLHKRCCNSWIELTELKDDVEMENSI